MPGYRKTKNVDLEKMQRASTQRAGEEIEYQKNYAQRRSAETDQEETRGDITQREANRRRQSYERVNPDLKPKPKASSGTDDLLTGIKDLLEFGKKKKKGFEDLHNVAGR